MTLSATIETGIEDSTYLPANYAHGFQAQSSLPLTWRGVGRTIDQERAAGFYVRGINLGIGPDTINTATAWTTSYNWTGHTKPNIDRIVSLGANTVRIQGCLTGYEVNPAQFVTRYRQVMDYCRSKGLKVLYALLNGFDDPTLTTANNARNAAMATALITPYVGEDFILGWDMGNELAVGTQNQYDTLVAYRAAILAIDPNAKITSSIAGTPTGLQIAAVTTLDPVVDFHDVHLYAIPDLANGWHANWLDDVRSVTDKPFMIGEFGGNWNNGGTTPLGSDQAQADYISSILRFAAEDDCMGFIQWAIQDDNAAYRFGMYDAAGNPRRQIESFQAYPDRRQTGAVARAVLAARTSPVVLDNFARANSGSSVGTSPVGGTPTALAGTWGIVSKTAQVVTDAGGSHNILTWDAHTADAEVLAEFVRNNANFNAGVVFRAVDASNFLLAQCLREGGPFVRIYKSVAGAFTLLGSVPAESFGQVATGGSSGVVPLRILTRGDRIFVYERDRLVINLTDATFNTATKFGVYTYASQDVTRAKFYKFAVNVPLRAY